MERFRHMARELNIDVVNQGIACLPRDNRKYAGSVTRVNRVRGNAAWVLRIRQDDFRYQRTFDSKAVAYNQMRNINIREGLRIKNHFTVFQSHVVVELTCGISFKCDIEDLHIVEDHVWGINGNGYVTTTHNGLTLSFHNAVMNFEPNSISSWLTQRWLSVAETVFTNASRPSTC